MTYLLLWIVDGNFSSVLLVVGGMFLQFQDPALGGKLMLTDEVDRWQSQVADAPLIHIIWNRTEQPVELAVDGVQITLTQNCLTTTTFLQRVKIPNPHSQLTIFSFNREFYCIHTHDEEVSCNGIIFFGAQQTPIIHLEPTEAGKFEMLYLVFRDEFSTRDNIQGEMLQMLLKRLIIKITRLARENQLPKGTPSEQVETIRKFNMLVDQHFREKRLVSDYAELLFKSPKTLSNVFAKHGNRTPLQIIHERIVLEAKRQLLYTDKTVKEISHELGFDEVASFHKLFKKVTHCSPQQYKNESIKASA